MKPLGVDDAFARHLVVGSHAEGITCLAVAVVIEADDCVLLVEVAGQDFIDAAFELPSGCVLPGETLLDALDRIVAITTGLQVEQVTGYLGHHDQQGDEASPLRVFLFSATVLDPRQICRAATVGHQWVTTYELVSEAGYVVDDFVNLGPPGTAQAIDHDRGRQR